MTVRPVLMPHYLDASVLVKLVVDEDCSSLVRDYMFDPGRSWRVCTSFCFAEAVGVLKSKNKRKKLSYEGYLAGSRKLIQLVRNESILVLEGDYSSLVAFAEAERIVKNYGIDFLDAFQLLSVKNSWKYLASPSQPILVTADGDLSKAAEGEGVKCWHCRETHQPKC